MDDGNIFYLVLFILFLMLSLFSFPLTFLSLFLFNSSLISAFLPLLISYFLRPFSCIHREAWLKTSNACGLCSEQLLDSETYRDADYYIRFVTVFLGPSNTFRDKT